MIVTLGSFVSGVMCPHGRHVEKFALWTGEVMKKKFAGVFILNATFPSSINHYQAAELPIKKQSVRRLIYEQGDIGKHG